MRDVRESSAGKSLSTYVILNPKGEHVATMRAHYANSGGVVVNVLNHGDEACERTARAMGHTIGDDGRIETGAYAYTVASMQVGRAGGYGYDKTTAALSGLYVDGVKLTNHCEERLAPPRGRLWRDSDRKRLARKGFALANYSPARESGREMNGYGRKGVPDSEAGWTDAYRSSGLDILRDFGYRVIQAL
jgi:hypothetical protein